MKIENRFRWVIVFLIFFIMILNYIDRISMSYAIMEISKEYHFNTMQKGYIFSAFSLGFSISVACSIRLVRRYGANNILIFSACLWSLATFCTGLANTFLSFFLTRVLLGLAEGPNFPCLAKVIYNWLLPQERNRAFAFSIVAIPFAFALSAPIVSYLIHTFSWRINYFFLGIIGFLSVVLWIVFYCEDPNQSLWINFDELKKITTSKEHDKKNIYDQHHFIKIIQDKKIAANLFAHAVFGFYLFFYITWIPQYLDEIYQFDISKIGLYNTIMWASAGIGLLCFSFFLDWLFLKIKKSDLLSYNLLRISHAGAGILLLPLLFIQSPNIDMFFLSLSLTFMMSSSPLYYTLAINMLNQKAPEIIGFSGFLFAMTGIISPLISAWVIKNTGSFHSMFLLIAVLSLISALVGIICSNSKTV